MSAEARIPWRGGSGGMLLQITSHPLCINQPMLSMPSEWKQIELVKRKKINCQCSQLVGRARESERKIKRARTGKSGGRLQESPVLPRFSLCSPAFAFFPTTGGAWNRLVFLVETKSTSRKRSNRIFDYR